MPHDDELYKIADMQRGSGRVEAAVERGRVVIKHGLQSVLIVRVRDESSPFKLRAVRRTRWLRSSCFQTGAWFPSVTYIRLPD